MVLFGFFIFFFDVVFDEEDFFWVDLGLFVLYVLGVGEEICWFLCDLILGVCFWFVLGVR